MNKSPKSVSKISSDLPQSQPESSPEANVPEPSKTEPSENHEEPDSGNGNVNLQEGLLSGEKLHGKLLKFLRDNHEMKLLMICREIKSIEVSGGVAVLSIDESFDEEFEESKKFLTEFFGNLGLSYKILETESKAKRLERLKQLLGDKLIVTD